MSVASLLEDPEDEGYAAGLREIWRRAQTNAEERSRHAVRGSTWTAADGSRDSETPILLLPVALEARGRIGNLCSIPRTGTVQVNLVLLHVLETELGIRLTPDDLIPLLQGDDEGESFDPSPVYRHLADQCSFHVREVAVLGNFAFQKVAMVNDLKERGEDPRHP